MSSGAIIAAPQRPQAAGLGDRRGETAGRATSPAIGAWMTGTLSPRRWVSTVAAGTSRAYLLGRVLRARRTA